MVFGKTRRICVSIFSGITILFFFSHNVAAQEAISSKHDGAFFALSTANYDSMVVWYTEKLGFNLIAESENNFRKGALLSKQGFLLEIVHRYNSIPPLNSGNTLESNKRYGIIKIGFIIANIEQYFEEIREKGIEIFFPIVNADAGYKTFGIKDPEGNKIQFFEKTE